MAGAPNPAALQDEADAEAHRLLSATVEHIPAGIAVLVAHSPGTAAP